MMDYGKIPPQAPDLEEVVLGAMLLDNSVLENVISVLTTEDAFYKEAHQIIYRSIRKLYGSGKAVDILTVMEDLRKEEALERTGGAVYLSNLTSRVGSGAHASEHALIILQKYVMREAIRIASNLSERAFDESSDAEDMIAEMFTSVNELQATLLSNKRGHSLAEVLNKSIDDYFARKAVRQSGETVGIKTPLKALNRITNGWQDSDLIILAARPSMGKTAFAISALMHAAKQRKATVMFSIEMTSGKIGDRMLIGEGHLDASAYRSGTMMDEDEQIIEKIMGDLAGLNVIIHDEPKQTVSEIWGKCRILKSKGRCDFIIIDYVGLISASKERGKSREQEVSEISSNLKAMAKDLDVPVMVLSQLNRGVEMRGDKRPNLADLRESGSLEQDADLVIFLYRDEYYNPGNSVGVGECIVAKHRNGKVGLVEFNYNSSITRIWDEEDHATIRPF
jgi:replicative DNA helicase